MFLYFIPYIYFILSWLMPLLTAGGRKGFQYGAFCGLIFGTISSQIYCLAVTLWLMKLSGITEEEIGFSKISKLWSGEAVFAVGLGVAWWLGLELSLAALNYYFTLGVGAAFKISLRFEDMGVFPASYRALKYLILSPVVEEVFFRGFLLTFLLKKGSFTKSLLLSSFIFALYHFTLGDFFAGSFLWKSGRVLSDFPPIFLSGIIYGLLYKKYRSIWIPFAAHLTYNLFATNIHISML